MASSPTIEPTSPNGERLESAERATPTTVTSRIDHVSVHPSGAYVSRKGVVEVPDGRWPGCVRFEGLPLALDDDTIRVEIFPADSSESSPEQSEDEPSRRCPVATATAVGLEPVHAEDAALRPPRNEELLAARRNLARLRQQLQVKERAYAAILDVEMVERPVPDDGTPPAETSVAVRRTLADLVSRRSDQLVEAIAHCRRLVEDAQEELASLEDEERRASSARRTRPHEVRKALLITLDATRATVNRVVVVVTYRVAGARWAPSYAVVFDPAFETCRLSMRAAVLQDTGEDWTGVTLTLSTANAVGWVDLPRLTSARIGRRRQSDEVRGWRAPPVGTDDLFHDWDLWRRSLRSTVEAAAPALKQQAEFSDGDSDFDSDGDDVIVAERQEAVPEQKKSSAPAHPLLLRSAAPIPGGPARTRSRASALSRFHAGDSMAFDQEGCAPEPAAMASPAAPLPRRRGQMKDDGSDGGSPIIEASSTYTDYGNLRMAGIVDERRGHLVPVPRHQRYRDVSDSLRNTSRTEIDSILATALSRARQAEKRTLPPGYVAPADVDGFDHGYHGSAPVEIPSDGRFHIVPVEVFEAPSSLCHVIVPRHALQAYRVVGLTNPLDGPLLEGPVDVMVGADLVMTSRIRSVPPRGSFEICLGVEQTLKVARNVRYEEETTGLLGKDRVLRHVISIEVSNHMSTDTSIDVREVIPVPSTAAEDELRVVVADVDPHWEPFEERERPVEGAWHWVLQLEAGETCHLRVRYDVEMSARWELEGGNRREA